MFFSNKDQLIGLDIGSRAIKLGQVVQSKSGPAILKKFGISSLPQGAIVEGRIEQPDVVAETIRTMLKDLKIKEQRVATSIAGYSVIIKKIVVSKQADDELHKAMPFEAEQYIPFDVEEMNIDFHILGDHETNPNQMNVMMVAAKKDSIDQYANILEQAGLVPSIIDVDVFAMERAYENSYLAESKGVALIDIGANKLNVNILQDGASAFTRDVAIGGEEITRQISSKFGCSFEEAEEIKLGEKKNAAPQQDIQEIVESFTASWSGEIRRVIDFYYSTYPEATIDRIILSGGATQTPGFIDYLATEASIPVEMFNPFANVQIKDKGLDQSYLKSVAPQAVICMGLASRTVNDK